MPAIERPSRIAEPTSVTHRCRYTSRPQRANIRRRDYRPGFTTRGTCPPVPLFQFPGDAVLQDRHALLDKGVQVVLGGLQNDDVGDAAVRVRPYPQRLGDGQRLPSARDREALGPEDPV